MSLNLILPDSRTITHARQAVNWVSLGWLRQEVIILPTQVQIQLVTCLPLVSQLGLARYQQQYHSHIKCSRVWLDTFKPKGLAQPVVANVVGYLASSKLKVPGSSPRGLGALVYTDRFTSDAIQEFGKPSLRFPHKVFLRKTVHG